MFPGNAGESCLVTLIPDLITFSDASDRRHSGVLLQMYTPAEQKKEFRPPAVSESS